MVRTGDECILHSPHSIISAEEVVCSLYWIAAYVHMHSHVGWFAQNYARECTECLSRSVQDYLLVRIFSILNRFARLNRNLYPIFRVCMYKERGVKQLEKFKFCQPARRYCDGEDLLTKMFFPQV